MGLVTGCSSTRIEEPTRYFARFRHYLLTATSENMPEETFKIKTLRELKLLLKLYNCELKKGTVKDYARAIGGVNWTMTHYRFLKKCVSTNVLTFCGSVFIFGKSYPVYKVNKKLIREIIANFLDGFREIAYDLVEEDHWVFP